MRLLWPYRAKRNFCGRVQIFSQHRFFPRLFQKATADGTNTISDWNGARILRLFLSADELKHTFPICDSVTLTELTTITEAERQLHFMWSRLKAGLVVPEKGRMKKGGKKERGAPYTSSEPLLHNKWSVSPAEECHQKHAFSLSI